MPSPLPVATLGALCALGASLAFSLNDLAIKSLSGGYPLHQITLIRAILALIVTLAVIMPLTGGWRQIRTTRPGLHLIRSGFILASNLAFYAAVAALPLAEATAIFFVSPLLLALFAMAFLGERVGPWRWGAILAGLAGVALVIRPGSAAFAPVALLPLLAAACYAASSTMTRRLGLRESAATLAFYIQFTFLTFSTVVGLTIGDGRLDLPGHGASLAFLTRAWIVPPMADWPMLALAGVGSAMGGLLISQAYRLCEAALVAPFEYAALPMAILWGFVVFGDFPDAIAWVGIALILAAGLTMVWRETRARAADPATKASGLPIAKMAKQD
jgi:drug/metabolite transporter (DMT)-like permease